MAYIERYRNFDVRELVATESHAGQGESAPPYPCDVAATDCHPVFACAAALAILDRVDVVGETLGW